MVLTQELPPFISHVPHPDVLIILVYILYPSAFLSSCIQDAGTRVGNPQFPFRYLTFL